MVLLIGIPFLLTAVIYAFGITFSQFSPYDDEGRVMISVKGFLSGNALYNDVSSPYGPIYYFYEWIVHTLLRVPLTNDATAVLCVAHWLLAAGILALAGHWMTRSVPMAVFIFMQAVVHLSPLAGEPGHPQELIVMLRALAALVVVRGASRRWTLPGLGAIWAALILIKINVGVFFAMAFFLTLLAHTGGINARSWIFWLILIVSAFLPMLLMRPHLAEKWAFDYAWQTGFSIVAIGIAAWACVTERPLKLRAWVTCGLAAGSTLLLIVFILLMTGSAPADVVRSLIPAPSKVGHTFFLPLNTSSGSWSCALALLVACAVPLLRKHFEKWVLPIAILKGIYGVLGTVVLVSEPSAQQALLKPWVWLLILGLSGGPFAGGPGLFPRVFLCFACVWQGLQAYPVAGTQVAVGTLLLVLICSICLFDSLSVLLSSSVVPSPSQKACFGRMAQWPEAGLIAALLATFALGWCNPGEQLRRYSSMQPLNLRGCSYRRVDPHQAAQYRAMAKVLETGCDTFIVLPGLNSLYFWTAKNPPTYFNISGENTMPSKAQQALVVAALQSSRRSLVVLRDVDWWHPEVSFRKSVDCPLTQYIRQNYHTTDHFGGFRILAPKRLALSG
ncbi:MAG: hypothetical protein ACREP9_06010, partial [Candidatus Dormibacteraceae bacterium]